MNKPRPHVSQKGITSYQIATVKDQYITVGCNIFLKGAEGEDNYIARVVRLFEREKDGTKMVRQTSKLARALQPTVSPSQAGDTLALALATPPSPQ